MDFSCHLANISRNSCAVSLSGCDMTHGCFVSLIEDTYSVAHQYHRIHFRDCPCELFLSCLEWGYSLSKLLSLKRVLVSCFDGSSCDTSRNPSHLNTWVLENIVGTRCKVQSLVKSIMIRDKDIFQFNISTNTLWWLKNRSYFWTILIPYLFSIFEVLRPWDPFSTTNAWILFPSSTFLAPLEN